jgi:hypothetical protein
MMFCGELSRGRKIYIDNYVNMLDVFAFGLTALEFLVEVMEPKSAMAGILWPAWQSYWRYAVEHWQIIHGAFKTHPVDSPIWKKLRAEFTRTMVAQNLESRLNDLRRALQQAAQEAPQYANLLVTLSRTLETKPIGWGEVTAMFADSDPPVRAEKSHMRNVTSSTAPTESGGTPTQSPLPDGHDKDSIAVQRKDMPRVPPQGRLAYARARSHSVRHLGGGVKPVAKPFK